jgi:hypothetical protein
MPELSLWLDYYDDIYSDFDSRHYLKRRISEDFLHELRMARKYKKERVSDLVMLLPEEKRTEDTERIIISSLNDFFKDQVRNTKEKYRKKLNTGIALLVAGLVTLTINSYINFKTQNSFIFSVIRILLEPGGWFLLWLSFDILFYDLRTVKKEIEFFKELSEVNIHFKSS